MPDEQQFELLVRSLREAVEDASALQLEASIETLALAERHAQQSDRLDQLADRLDDFLATRYPKGPA